MGAWPVELDPHALLPAQWLREARGQDVRVYNPALTRYRDRLFIHYNNNFRTRPNRIFLVEVDPDTLAQVRYYAGAYAFAAAPPFRPLWLTPEPVLRPEEERRRRTLGRTELVGVVWRAG